MPATMYFTGAVDGTWTNVGNWVESDGTAPAAVPGTGDSVVFDARMTRALTGVPSGTIRLSKVQIKHSVSPTNYIGTPTTPITAAVDTFIVGEETTDGFSYSGCQQICWNFGATASGYSGSTVRILKTNTTGVNGLEVVQLLGTHASNKMYAEGASVIGWGVSFPGQAYTVATTDITGNGARVNLGSGGTVTNIYQANGNILINCAYTLLEQSGGNATTEGSGAGTTSNVGGVLISNSTGTQSALNVRNGGLADFSKSPAARTITTPKVYGTGKLNMDNGVPGSITCTNPPEALQGAKTSQIEFGTNRSIQQGVPA